VSTFQYLSEWKDWTLNQAGTGIVKEGFAFAAEHNFHRNYGLFLQGDNGSASRDFNLSAGVWEFSFKGGQRFASGSYQKQVVQVKIDGAVIFEEELKAGELKNYFSKAFTHSGGDVAVEIKGINPDGDNSAVVEFFEFREVLDWNDSANWNNDTVSTGINDSVLIPSGSRVYLDASRNTGHLHIQGGLSFVDSGNSIHLQSRSILVDGQDARLQAGIEASPYEGDLLLSLLYGSASENLENFGTRFIGARLQGELSLHGKNVQNYVQLANTANGGSSDIFIPRTASWQPGDLIVITSTAGSHNDSGVNGWDQAEVRTITAIVDASDDRSQITLNSPLSHTHTSSDYTAQRTAAPAASWNYGVKAYVGLLSRNVTIQGAIAAPLDEGLGGHVMIMGAHNGMPTSGLGKMSNVEFYRMGQEGMLARYPFHWHLLGDDGAGQFIKNCSVHASFNRMITIHGTHQAEVIGNVGYDHIGHGIFLEDGSEENNIINENLVVLSRQATAGSEVLPTDIGVSTPQNAFPSSFWVSNPRNTMERNIAAGTEGTGFWFIFNSAPTGPSATDSRFSSINPRQNNLISFKDNVSASSALGFDVNDSVDEVTLALVKNQAWHPSSGVGWIDGLRVTGNRVGIYTGLGNSDGEVNFIRSILIDNERDTMFASYNRIEESLFVDRVPENLMSLHGTAFSLYDGPARAINNHFVGYDAAGATIVQWGGGSVTRSNWFFEGATYDHAGLPRITYTIADSTTSSHQMEVLVDVDGSLSGVSGGAAIVTAHPILQTSNSLSVPSLWQNAYLSDGIFITLICNYPGSSVSQNGDLEFTRVDWNTGERVSAEANHPTINNSPMILIANNPSYYYEMHFPAGNPVGSEVQIGFRDSEAGDEALLVLPGFDALGASISNAVEYASLNDLILANQNGYFRDGTDLWFKHVSTATSYVTVTTMTVTW